jgi:hypothetical protein
MEANNNVVQFEAARDRKAQLGLAGTEGGAHGEIQKE